MDAAGFLSTVWLIFSFSFLMALTGAMAPGPLFTYTIIKSAKTKNKGYLMGVWIITGHAILEFFIVLLLLSGFSFVLTNIYVVRGIGVTGGLILIIFGIMIIRDVIKGKIQVHFLNNEEKNHGAADKEQNEQAFDNPVLGGIFISMANPYWWVWWATIGLSFMVQFKITLDSFPKLAAFFLGHEMGDLIWYVIVSTLAYYGIRRLNKKAYYGILFVCGLFMIGFGIFLGASPLFQKGI